MEISIKLLIRMRRLITILIKSFKMGPSKGMKKCPGKPGGKDIGFLTVVNILLGELKKFQYLISHFFFQ